MPRVDSLTGLRWWAAFFVFAYHMHVFAPLPNVLGDFLKFGFFGVTFFFVLSGFVLTWSASNRVATSTFYWRRFARIYPSHVVALLLAIPVFYSFNPQPADDWVKPVSVGALALSFVLLQGWSRDPSILFAGNPASWTLTCEAFFYALHPLLGRLVSFLRVRGALIFVVAVLAMGFAYRVMSVALPQLRLGAIPLPVVHLGEFAIGIGLAWAIRCGWRPRIPESVGLASVAACIAAFALAPRFAPESAVTAFLQQFSNELFTITCAVAVVAFANRALSGRTSWLAGRTLVRLGEWSYAFYLVHATFIYIALALLGVQSASWFNLCWFAVLFVVGVLCAAALHHAVEKPLERRIRAWQDARVSRRQTDSLEA